MVSSRLAVLALLVAAAAVSAQPNLPPRQADLVDKGAAVVKDADLAALLKNQTLDHQGFDGRVAITIFYREDGVRFVKTRGGIRQTKWWLKDDQRCEDSVGGAGKPVCFRMLKAGDGYRACAVDDGACPWVVKARAGDPDGLSTK